MDASDKAAGAPGADAAAAPGVASLAAALGGVDLVAPDVRSLGPLLREALAVAGLPVRLAGARAVGSRPVVVAPYARLNLLQEVDAAASFLAVPEAALAQVRAGQGVIVFDGAAEGRALTPRHVATLHALLDRHGIPPARAVWAQQNRALEARYRAHCARKGWSPMHVVAAHSHAAALWRHVASGAATGAGWRLGFAAHAGGVRRHRWVCLNYNLRAARVLLVSRLLRGGVPGFLSFSVTRPTKGAESEARLLAGAAALWPQDPDGARAEVASLLRSGLHHGSDVDGFASVRERLYSLPAAEVAASDLFIVTETEMDGAGLVRWTEKTLKALGSGLPFVVFGNAGVLRDLRRLGFDVLDDLVDHAYDEQPGGPARFAAAEASVRRFLARAPGFTAAELDRLRAAAAHNAAVFRTALIEDALLAPMARILALAGAPQARAESASAGGRGVTARPAGA
jgi:hypothetical protein